MKTKKEKSIKKKVIAIVKLLNGLTISEMEGIFLQVEGIVKRGNTLNTKVANYTFD